MNIEIDSKSVDEFHFYDNDIEQALNKFQRRAAIDNPVLFFGSSTIRLWDTIEQDIGDPRVVGVGCGGGTCISGIYYLNRVIEAVTPTAVFLYFGQNDIACEGLSGTEAFLRWVRLVESVQCRLPLIPIVALSVKYSPARWHLAADLDEMNTLVRNEVKERSGLHWVELNSSLLGMNGKPAERYFADDRIHLNSSGYKQIAPKIRELWPILGL